MLPAMEAEKDRMEGARQAVMQKSAAEFNRRQAEQREKDRAENAATYGAMPVGARIGIAGSEKNDAVFWEKTGADEWTRNGIGSEKPTKTNAEMEGGRVIAPAEDAADASEAIFAAVDSSTTGVTSEPTSPQAIQASPQPAQAGAAPAASAAPGQAGTTAPAGTSTVRALTDGAPAENTGAQAAPAAGAQGEEAQGGAVEALRQQLRDVEARIIQAAPAALGQGGGDIEAAMKSRKVPVTLKAQRKKLVEQVRAAQATEVRAFAPETGTLGIPRADMPQVNASAAPQKVADVRFAQHHYTLYRGRENVDLWVVEKDAGASAFSNWPREIAIGDTKEQALAAFRDKYDSLDLQNAVRKAAFDIFSERGSNAFFVGKKIGRNYAKLEGPFKTVKEAREYREKNLAALGVKLEKYKEIPRERADVNQPRVGVDMRNGQDVTPQMFGEVFGFRGVEFGNWVEQKRRQKDLNDAFDALMDMAAVLDIPPKAISLNGELGLAFGARGGGGVNPAAAHYEPDMVVINLTKKEGAGSLGHEWWHALDNYFSKQRKTNRGSFMTTSTDVGLAARGKDYFYEGGVRQEMIDAFGAVVKAINQTAMKARAAKLDGKRSKEYWTTGEEMAARAFESYLISKLQDQDASNDYLANVVSEKTWDAMAALGMENENSYPYPTAAEIPAIRAGFDHFFQTVETKEDDAGNVAMFSSADSTLPARPLSLDRVNQLVQEALSGIRGAPPVEVTARPGDIGLRVPAGSVGYGVTLRSGDIYVFQSAMGSDLDVFKTVFHELFHRGVRVLVPKAQYVQTMLDLAKGDSRIQQLAIEWKNTEMGQKQKDNLREQGYTGAELTGQYEALAIEEALAAVAEEIKAEGKLGSKPKNMTIRFLANWLAKLADMAGMKKLAQGIRAMTYNEAERFVMSAIDRSGEPVQAGRTDNMSAKRATPGTDQTQTDAFKRWFKGSKVVDADGKPLVVYHGTKADISAFEGNRATEKDAGWFGRGIYFTADPNLSSAYAEAEFEERQGRDAQPGANVIPVYLSLQNPYVWPKWRVAATTRAEADAIRKELEAAGHDGVIVPNGYADPAYAGFYEVVAFRPGQIKSAIGNRGTFDPENADIRFRSADLRSLKDSVGDAVKSVTVQSIKDAASYKKADWLGLGLQALGRRQIVEIYGKDLPGLQTYSGMAAQMEADKNEVGAEADALATRWGRLKDERQLAELMHDATLAQIDPEKAHVPGDDQARHRMLQARFNALSDEAKAVYRDARAAYHDHHAKVRTAIGSPVLWEMSTAIGNIELDGKTLTLIFEAADSSAFAFYDGAMGQVEVTRPNGDVERHYALTFVLDREGTV